MAAHAPLHPWVAHADRYDRMLEPFTDPLLDRLRPGHRVLDVGCGAGATTVAAAHLVGPAGRVTALDPEPALLDHTRRRAEAAGLDNIDYVGRRFEEHIVVEPVDRLIARFSLMLLDDPETSFARLADAIRPGGELRAVVWAEPSANRWATLPLQVLSMHGIGAPGDASAERPTFGGGPFGLADAQRLRDLLAGAGFVDIAIVRLETNAWVADDPDDAVDFYDDNAGGLLSSLDPATADAVRADLRRLLDLRSTDDGVRLAAAAWSVAVKAPEVRR